MGVLGGGVRRLRDQTKEADTKSKEERDKKVKRGEFCGRKCQSKKIEIRLKEQKQKHRGRRRRGWRRSGREEGRKRRENRQRENGGRERRKIRRKGR